MIFKSLRVPTSGLAGVVAMAATAGPAVADEVVNPVPTFMVPADSANEQPGGAFSSFDINFANSVTGKPLTQQVLAANNAETPAFGNLFSTNNGHPQVHLIGAPPANQIIVPANLGGFPGGGLEQPAWNPQTTIGGGPLFWISVPQLSGGTTPQPK